MGGGKIQINLIFKILRLENSFNLTCVRYFCNFHVKLSYRINLFYLTFNLCRLEVISTENYIHSITNSSFFSSFRFCYFIFFCRSSSSQTTRESVLKGINQRNKLHCQPHRASKQASERERKVKISSFCV